LKEKDKIMKKIIILLTLILLSACTMQSLAEPNKTDNLTPSDIMEYNTTKELNRTKIEG